MLLNFICMSLAILCLGYAGYLHIYYHIRGVRTLKEAEEEKFMEFMKELGYDENEIKEQLRTYSHIEDLRKTNKKLKKALK